MLWTWTCMLALFVLTFLLVLDTIKAAITRQAYSVSVVKATGVVSINDDTKTTSLANLAPTLNTASQPYSFSLQGTSRTYNYEKNPSSILFTNLPLSLRNNVVTNILKHPISVPGQTCGNSTLTVPCPLTNHFTRLGPDVYFAGNPREIPYGNYLGYELNPFVCEQTDRLEGFIQCWALNGQYSANFTLNTGTLASTISILHVNNTNEEMTNNVLITLALARLSWLQNYRNTVDVLEYDINTRRENSRVAVAFLWIFIAISGAVVVVISAIWQSWLFPLFDKISPKLLPYCILIWSVLGITIYQLISWFTGLGGFIAVCVVCIFHSSVINIIYCIVRVRARQRAKILKSYISTEEKEHILSQPNSPAMNFSGRRSIIIKDGGAMVKTEGGTGTGNNLGGDGGVGDVYTSSRKPYATINDKLGAKQWKTLIRAIASLVVSLACVFIIFGVWIVDEYALWNRRLQKDEVEYIPQTVSKGVAAMYVFEGYANILQMNNGFFTFSTQWCGRFYNRYLTDYEREVEINRLFILKYNIDMTLFAKSHYSEFVSVNDWFIRSLRVGVRPTHSGAKVVVSPADARVVAFTQVPPDQAIWLKGETMTMSELLGGKGVVQGWDPSVFDNGSLVIVRLAPQDYHRFHTPVAGYVLHQYPLSGGLHSVNADGMTSGNYAIMNKRLVVIMQPDDPELGLVALVAIGATCVGSIELEPKFIGTSGASINFKRGDPFGFFQFGGSTVAMVFQSSAKVKFDPDILIATAQRVEVLVETGQKILSYGTPAPRATAADYGIPVP